MTPRSSARPFSRPIAGYPGCALRLRSSRMSWPWSGRKGIDVSERPVSRRRRSSLMEAAIERHHVGVAPQMLGFVEGSPYVCALRASRFAGAGSERGRPKSLHHSRQVVVRPGAKRARAKRNAACGAVHRRHDRGVVRLGRHDPRQARAGRRADRRGGSRGEGRALRRSERLPRGNDQM